MACPITICSFYKYLDLTIRTVCTTTIMWINIDFVCAILWTVETVHHLKGQSYCMQTL